ncbi:hypothetical protein G6F22_022000 [Rhizopus arrhizus]|nr:hypothetical protein G6F22_022000 [Rhizopus arrhizus]
MPDPATPGSAGCRRGNPRSGAADRARAPGPLGQERLRRTAPPAGMFRRGAARGVRADPKPGSQTGRPLQRRSAGVRRAGCIRG